MHRGDVITAINGTAVTDSNVLRNRCRADAAGNGRKVSLLRDGKEADCRP